MTGDRQIAVTGLACRFPGGVRSGEDLWRLLVEGRDAIGEIPPERADLRARYSPERDQPGKIISRWAGVVDGVDQFDAAFFGIAPHEARQMDPQQRLLLEVTYEALENAGIPMNDPLLRRAGVFVGISGSDYGRLLGADPHALDAHYGTGQATSIAANRVSYFFDMHGPSLSVDTACSSSLVAVHLAVRALRAGECDMALVAGVNLTLAPDLWVSFSRFGMLSPTGTCHSFGADADGYVRSDGCGVLVLRTLDGDGPYGTPPSQAQRGVPRHDAPVHGACRGRDEVLAVIRGSAVNSDGRSNGLTAPNGTLQEEVIRRALADAGLAPDRIGCVEAHGSGTPLGDPIEVRALARTYGADRAPDRPCYVGSVKSNLGHAEAAAGIAGIIKLVLCLRHGTIPATLHATVPNPRLRLNGSGLLLAATAQEWTGERIGAVSAFGFGGTNAHVIVAQPETAAPRPAAEDTDRQRLVLPLSARHPVALRSLCDAYARWLDLERPDLADVCHTAAVHRSRHDLRAAFPAGDPRRLRDELRGYADSPPDTTSSARWRDTVMVFSGQGREFPGMGYGVLNEPVFASHAARCDDAFRAALGVSVTGLLADASADAEILGRTDVAQAVLFTLQSGLVELWRGFGLKPAAVVGHSAGEIAAAFAAGLLDFDAALRLVLARGAALRGARGSGRMAWVNLDADAAASAIGEVSRGEGVVVAAENSPTVTVLSGPEAALDAVLAGLARKDVGGGLLPGGYAFHSPAMADAADDLVTALAGLRAGEPSIPMFSAVTGELVRPGDMTADYWARGLTGPVRFRSAIKAACGAGFDCFLEHGPRTTHATGIRATAAHAGADAQVLSALPNMGERIGHVLAQLHRRGADLDWAAVYPIGRFLRSAPGYPWQHTRHWAAPDTEPATPEVRMDRHQRYPATAERSPDPGDGRAEIEQTVRSALADLLGCDASEIAAGATFLGLGADSLALVRLVGRLNERYGVQLDAADLLDRHSTATALAGHLATRVKTASPAALLTTASGMRPPTGAGAFAGPESAEAAGSGHAETVPSRREQIIRDQISLMREQLKALDWSSADDGSAEMATIPGEPVRSGLSAPVRDDPQGSASQSAEPATPSRAGDLSADQKAYVKRLAGRLAQTSSTSRLLADRHRPRLAESRPWANFRPELKELIVPLVAERAAGSRIWDADGMEYTDYCLGFGVHFFGHNPPFVVEAVQRQLHKTFSLGPQVALAYQVAERLCRITGHDRVTFCNTGSEAVMGAVRLARLATGRTRIAYFTRSYHGLTDPVLGQPAGPPGEAEPISPGISAQAVGEAIVLRYGHSASLEHLRAHAGEIAAVLVEPVQNRDPAVQPAEFLSALRSLTRQHGIVLIFDEMITGFRIGLRGAQGHFGVTPDLSTYGKLIGGGLPIAVIAGKAELLNGMDGGPWRYGDDSGPYAPMTLFGGTFQKHPLALAAADAVLARLEEQATEIYPAINARAEHAVRGLTEIVEAEGLPYTLASFGPLWRFQYQGVANLYQPLQLEMLYHSLLTEGLYVWEGRTFFLSTAHDDADIDRLHAAVRTSLRSLRQAGFLSEHRGPGGHGSTAHTSNGHEPADHRSGGLEPGQAVLPATPHQRRLHELCQRLGPASTAYNEAVLLELNGPLQVDTLQTAMDAVHEWHPMLRATCSSDGCWLSIGPTRPAEMPMLESSDEHYGETITDYAQRPYDLGTGPLFRPALVRRPGDRNTLLLCAHHIIVDGGSYEILLTDLARAYTAVFDGDLPTPNPSAWPAAPRVPRTPETDRHWRNRLAHPPEPIWTPGPRPPARASRLTRHLEPDFWPSVEKVSTTFNCTPFTLLLAAFSAVLHRSTERRDLIIGVPTDRRGDFVDGAAPIGHFANTMPFRSQILGDPSFAEHVRNVRDALMLDLSHAHLPLFDIAALHPGPLPEEHLVQAVFDLNPDLATPPWPGLTTRLDMPPVGEAKHPLFFDVIPGGNTVLVDVTYRKPVTGTLVESIFHDWLELLLR